MRRKWRTLLALSLSRLFGSRHFLCSAFSALFPWRIFPRFAPRWRERFSRLCRKPCSPNSNSYINFQKTHV